MGTMVTTPFTLILACTLLVWKVGIVGVISLSVLFITVPLQFRMAQGQKIAQQKCSLLADARLKKSNEILQSMKILKMYGWEELFASNIESIRKGEMKQLFQVGSRFLFSAVNAQCMPVTISCLVFVVHVGLSSTPLTPDVVFTVLALSNLLIMPLTTLPSSIGYIVEGLSSMKRIERFLKTDDTMTDSHDESTIWLSVDTESEDYLDETNMVNGNSTAVEMSDVTPLVGIVKKVNYETTQPNNVYSVGIPSTVAVQITNGNFVWGRDAKTPILNNINVEFPAEKLTVVIGKIGAGKSSLIMALLGELTTITGLVNYSGKSKTSFAAQPAWLHNATLRDNILFGEDFNSRRYNAVLEVCALNPDIHILPGGDMTEIGGKGINISGGQKQRISLARALYAKTDIVMLDDPLSALDVHVSEHVMKKAILKFLHDERRTIILVTNHYRYIEHAAKVIVMHEGQISQQGDPLQIQREYPELFKQWQNGVNIVPHPGIGINTEHTSELESQTERSTTRRSITNGSLVVDEARQLGPISWNTFYMYGKAIKLPFVCVVVGLLLLYIGVNVMGNVWLTRWSQDEQDKINNTISQGEDRNTWYYVSVFAALCFIFVILSMLTNICQVKFSIAAAGRLHLKMINRIIHAPVRFFDTTPAGRILNRFAHDTMTVDLRIWMNVNIMISIILQISTTFIVNSIVTPLFLTAIFPIAIAVYLLQKYGLGLPRELRRLDSITKSPVLSHVTETIGGIVTVKAYRADKRFQQRFNKLVEQTSLCQLYFFTAIAWIAVRMMMIGNLIVFFCGFSSLLACVYGHMEPGFVGLGITTGLTVFFCFGGRIMQCLDFVTFINGVERVIEYTQVEMERYEGSYIPPANWPEKGSIIFKDVSARYSQTSNPVLRDVSIQVKPKEKIGVCGRTGSGKTSLTLTLLRMIDVFQGQIIIDGIDISQVPLLILRKRISIIPQDPHLFAGTIRFNLDPEAIHTNEELWNALRIAQLRGYVEDMQDQLDEQIPEGGDTFSAGQKQLFCLARAFLRKSQILIMDEATSSIDSQTDAMLQEVISTAFSDKTVLTIAHRISTILDSDTVLVLNGGQVIEYDTPHNLLKKDETVFASFVNASK
ncbi:ATP-binding cassette sub-family C member 8-like [Saccoglossus kowalevskii]|uniref:ATP-binding cassette sub-family C member 8-like n=1 Tax=Saccoglossus kowalevskii TaxID=10224 RepID=A0ABM0GRD4_SACKO|nr:PREDICTED: ATP-binding cassette sub-family C member 8-like [Saccoglossus kowalevskii]